MKINLYVNSIQVKTIKVDKDTDYLKRDYKVHIWNHKELFNRFSVVVTLRPVQLINATEKEADLNCIVYGGADIE